MPVNTSTNIRQDEREVPTFVTGSYLPLLQEAESLEFGNPQRHWKGLYLSLLRLLIDLIYMIPPILSQTCIKHVMNVHLV